MPDRSHPHRTGPGGRGGGPPSEETGEAPPRDPFDWYARNARSALLSRVRRRFGSHLRRALDPEDLVQESLVTALRTTRGRWRDSPSALVVFLRRIAELRLRHEGRRAGVRRALQLPDEGEPHEWAAPDAREHLGPGSGMPLGRWLTTETRLRGDHRWSLFLREWMGSPWDTQAFLLDRPTAWAVRSLHRRARAELVDRARD